jgi:hypothetical protein
MQEGLFFSKKKRKYCDCILKYFTIFAQEKLPKNKAYYPNILVQITVNVKNIQQTKEIK